MKLVTKCPRLTNVTEVRNFLILAGYHRRFAKDFSKITSPLTNLLNNTTKFERLDKCEETFQELKRWLTTVPIFTFSSGW